MIIMSQYGKQGKNQPLFEMRSCQYPSLILDLHEQLDSDLITEGLKLITKQHKSVLSQDCLLIQGRRCFESVMLCNHGDFCQVLHMKGANHWVSVTNIAAEGSEVPDYDRQLSIFPGG